MYKTLISAIILFSSIAFFIDWALDNAYYNY